MQFTLRVNEPLLDIRGLEDALRVGDPAALLDLDPGGQQLRMSTSLLPDEICRRLTWAGCEATPDRLQGVFAECCGGCGG
jgi:hypothetical protein